MGPTLPDSAPKVLHATHAVTHDGVGTDQQDANIEYRTAQVLGDVMLHVRPAGNLRVIFPASLSLWERSVPLATVPLPATFPLFATGLGALGLLGCRRKPKATIATS